MPVTTMIEMKGSKNAIVLDVLDECLAVYPSSNRDQKLFELSDEADEDEFNKFVADVQYYADGFYGTNGDKQEYRKAILMMFP